MEIYLFSAPQVTSLLLCLMTKRIRPSLPSFKTSLRRDMMQIINLLHMLVVCSNRLQTTRLMLTSSDTLKIPKTLDLTHRLTITADMSLEGLHILSFGLFHYFPFDFFLSGSSYPFFMYLTLSVRVFLPCLIFYSFRLYPCIFFVGSGLVCFVILLFNGSG